MNKFLFGVIAVILVPWSLMAAQIGGLIDGLNANPVSLDSVLQNIKPGQVLVVSEKHDDEKHHINQLSVLAGLTKLKIRFSVGFEFIDFTKNNEIDTYMAGLQTEESFLKAVGWGKIPFRFYKPLMMATVGLGFPYGINLPQKIASRIFNVGMAGLTSAERALLPSDFALGNAGYRKRVVVASKSHGGEMDPDQTQKFFEAMCAWDDTMAFQAVKALGDFPNQVLVIIVGNFHADFGGGLPDRLKARGVKDLTVITQVAAVDLTPAELQSEIQVSPEFGPHADYIWVTY